MEAMKPEPVSPEISEHNAEERAWDMLGHATQTRARSGFAADLVAAASQIPQERPLSRFPAWMHRALPLAAAAALAISLASPLLLPTSNSLSQPSAALIESAELLGKDPRQLSESDMALLEITALTDPSELSDEELIALMY